MLDEVRKERRGRKEEREGALQLDKQSFNSFQRYAFNCNCGIF